MRDIRYNIDIGNLRFRGVRETWDDGNSGYIELLDYEIRELFARVAHPVPGEPLQIVGYGQPIPRFVIEWLFKTADIYLV